MAKAVILAVDDEPQVLSVIERDLRQHFGENFRILTSSGGPEALQLVKELKLRAVPVALFLVDQRMPELDGTGFLAEAVKYYPDAKKALLTAYADTRAAISSINEIGLDYYFMKPWDPPDRELYPVLDDLLSDWSASVRLPYEGIRVIGTLWSANSHAIKDFLARNQVPYLWLDIEQDSEAGKLLDSLKSGDRDAGEAGNEESRIPVVIFPDGSHLVDPDLHSLARKVGLKMQAALPFYDLIIIGGGPAGLAAAVYSGSEGLRTVLIEREAPGGQAGTSSLIENYLGFPRGLSGADLARRATAQALRFNVEILNQEVTGLRVQDSYRYVRLADGGELSCHAVLIATGVSIRTLEAPGVERLTGAGIYYGAALTEATHYRDRDVIVVGGANSAGQGAMLLSRYSRKVFILVRGKSLSDHMSRYLVDHIHAAQNIEVLTGTTVAEARGGKHLESVLLSRIENPGELEELPASAMFIFIGAGAHTEMLDGFVERDTAGFLLTGHDLFPDGKRLRTWTLQRDPYILETSVPGVFAAGDVRHLSVKRVGSAVGEGAVAVALILQYLKTV